MMRAILRGAGVLVAVGLAGAWPCPAGAQEAAPKVAVDRGQATAVPPPATEGYSYKTEGRRDPFISLTAVRSLDRASGKRPEGLAGVMVGEVVVKGILLSRQSFIAMVQALDLKTYIVHVGDRLLDGTVKTITADRVIFLQEVNDPLSLTKQKEVPKTLRVLEEVK